MKRSSLWWKAGSGGRWNAVYWSICHPQLRSETHNLQNKTCISILYFHLYLSIANSVRNAPLYYLYLYFFHLFPPLTYFYLFFTTSGCGWGPLGGSGGSSGGERRSLVAQTFKGSGEGGPHIPLWDQEHFFGLVINSAAIHCEVC